MKKDKHIYVKKYTNINLDIKDQGHAEIMNVHNMFPHCDTSICQVWYKIVKRQRRSCPYTNSL